MPMKQKLAVLLIKDKQIIISHFYLINIHIFYYLDSRLSGLFTEVLISPDNRGSTVHVDHGRHQNVVGTSLTHSAAPNVSCFSSYCNCVICDL